MSVASFISRFDPRNIFVGRCDMHVYKTLLDDDSFAHAFGPKSEIGPCHFRNLSAKQDDDESENLAVPRFNAGGSEDEGQEFPYAQHLITVAGGGVGNRSCTNHMKFFHQNQKRSIYTQSNIRGGELNPNEPVNAHNLVKEREEKFKERSRNTQRRTVLDRARARFNSGIVDENQG